MKKISAKQAKELAQRRSVKAKLMKLAPRDGAGRVLCPQCGLLPDMKDGRGELHLCHEKSLAQGGRTSVKNCYLGCRADHFGEEGHRTENMPRSKPVDRPIRLSGYTTTLMPYSKEQQTGMKPRK